MAMILDYFLVTTVIAVAAGYAFVALAPKALRARFMNGWLGKLAGQAGKVGACGGCGDCGAGASGAAGAGPTSVAQEQRVPVSRIGHRNHG